MKRFVPGFEPVLNVPPDAHLRAPSMNLRAGYVRDAFCNPSLSGMGTLWQRTVGHELQLREHTGRPAGDGWHKLKRRTGPGIPAQLAPALGGLGDGWFTDDVISIIDKVQSKPIANTTSTVTVAASEGVLHTAIFLGVAGVVAVALFGSGRRRRSRRRR